MRMKILIVNTLYYPDRVGGAEISVQSLAEALKHLGHTPIIVTTDKAGKTKSDIINGISVYRVGIKNIYWPYGDYKPPAWKRPIWRLIDVYNPLMAKTIEAIIDIERPDVIHTNNLAGFSTTIWSVANAKKIPIVHTLRDYYLLCLASIMFKHGVNCNKQCIICNVYSTPKRILSKYVAAVIGISQFILSRHLASNLFNDANIKKVIHNSYDNQVATFANIHVQNYNGPLRVGYFGRIHPTKGVELILEALKFIADNEYRFIMAGDGDKEYINYLRQYSGLNISHLGFTSPIHFFKQIDVLIVPSLWHEPLGRVVIEAYAHGIPVVVSNRGGLPELVDEGKTGYIFDPTDKQQLIEIIKRNIEIKHSILPLMKKQCIEKSKEFSSMLIGNSYMEVYNKVLRNNKLSIKNGD